MAKSSRRNAQKTKRRNNQEKTFLAENGIALVAFAVSGIAGFVCLVIALAIPGGGAIACLVMPFLWLFAFVYACKLAGDEGNFVPFDFLEGLGGLRFVLMFGFFGFYLLGYIGLWMWAQVGCAVAEPKKYALWMLLQGFDVFVGIVVVCAGTIAMHNWLAPPVPPHLAKNDPAKNDPAKSDPFPPRAIVPNLNQAKKNNTPPPRDDGNEKKDQDDPPKKTESDDPVKKKESDEPVKKKESDEPVKKKEPLPTPPLTGDSTLDAALTDLESKNILTVRKAADVLSGRPPNEHRAVVAKKLAELVEKAEGPRRGAIVKALATWATREEVPLLIQIAGNKSEGFGRNDAIEALGKTRDERALKPLVACFQELGTRGAAEKALREIGPPAEKEVLLLLFNAKDFLSKQSAIRVLKDIGTQQSVPALQMIVFSKDIILRTPAQEALIAIAARAKK